VPTNFPTALDTFPDAATLASHTLNTDPHSTLHGNLGDALAALEAKVGVDGSSVPSALDYLLSLKAALASPTFTGSPSGPTPSLADSSTRLATTAYVQGQGYLTSVPPAPVSSVFSRVGVVVAVSGDYSVGQVTGAAPLASPAFTGVPTAPTAANGTNTAQLATTAFVLANAPALPPDVARTGVANTFTVGPQTIQTGADGNVGLVVKGNSPTQSANLQEWRDNNGAVRALINNAGTSTQLQLGPLTGGGAPNLNGISLDTSVAGTGGPRIRMFNSGNLDLNITCDNLGMHIDSPLIVSGALTGVSDLTVQTLAAKSASNPYVRIWLTGTHFFDWNASVANTLQLLNTSGRAIALFKEGAATVKFAVRGEASQLASLVQLQGESSIQTREQADLDTAWVDSTDATRKARVLLRAWDTAAREGLRIEADGTNPRIGFLGASAVSRPAVTGSRGGNAALASLLSALASLGLITDSTSA
jgi:hypothetical protein